MTQEYDDYYGTQYDNQAIKDLSPSNFEAEQATLGVMLQGNDLVTDKVFELIFKPEIFFHKRHQVIYKGLQEMRDRYTSIELITASGWFNDNKLQDEIGGLAYLTELASIAASPLRAEEYAGMVIEKYKLRSLMQAGYELVELSKRQDIPSEEVLGRAENKVLQISEEYSRGEVVSMGTALSKTIDYFQEKARTGGIGLPTGFIDLDDMLGGLQNNDLVILAARPSMGKTSLALNIALNAAKTLKQREEEEEGESQGKIMIFSLEMPVEQLVTRMLSMEAKIRSSDLLADPAGFVEDKPEFIEAFDTLHRLPIEIDDSSSIDVASIRSKCARAQKEDGVALVIVDYLQLMETSKDTENRQQAVSDMSRNLKLLAMSLKCPVLVLSQLSRAPENRPDHRPRLSDLRESGAIEQDADVVLMLYREAVYAKEEVDNPDVCEVHISKHRNGPVGVVYLGWNDQFTLFRNRALEAEGYPVEDYQGSYDE